VRVDVLHRARRGGRGLSGCLGRHPVLSPARPLSSGRRKMGAAARARVLWRRRAGAEGGGNLY
jgi:hypothetical protein